MAKRAELLVVKGGDLSGRRFAVGDAGLRLGRSSSNDIHVPDEELSRNHCFFEPSGEAGIRVTDLASANGTFVNGEALGNDAVELKPGDVIDVGTIRLTVVTDAAPSTGEDVGIDLGLGTAAGASPAAKGASPARCRSPVANVLWGVATVVMIAGIAVVLGGGDLFAPGEPPPSPAIPEKERVLAMRYEKVVADSSSVFRYCMTLSGDGTLRVAIDDVSDEKRHLDKPKKLSDNARGRLGEILLDPELKELDAAYAGPDVEPPALKSWALRVVYSGRVKDIRIVNTQEPEAFRRVREKLEVFSKNELGIWAIQRTRAQLIALAAECADVGRVKWEDREVEYGNLHAAIVAWREAIFYLDTVNPKPPEFDGYRQSLEKAVAELEKRFSEQRFRADRAINLKDWGTAHAELKILCQLVPDRDDDRYREASAKMVDVEKKMSEGGSR